MAVRKAEVLFIGDAASIVRAAQQSAAASEEAAAAAKAGAAEMKAANLETAASAKTAAAAQAASARRGKETLAGIGAGMKKAALGALAFGAVGVKFAIDFQHSMEMVHTQAGASQAEVERMGKSVLKLAKVTEQGPDKLAKALYDLESVGLRGGKALAALHAAADGAAVGNADLESTTSALAATMVAYHVSGEKARETQGALNSIVGVGKMHMQDLNDALSSGILPTAQGVGLKLRDVGAALATMTDAGVPAAQAANKLRTSFFLMAAPGTKAQAVLKTIGLKSDDMAKAMRKPNGLVGALKLLKDHLAGLSKTEKIAALSQAFGGSRSAATLVTLIDNLGRVQEKYKAIGEGTRKFGEAVAREHETAGHKIKVAWSSIQASMIQVGALLLPIAGKIAGAFATIVGKVLSVVSAFKQGKTWAVALVAVLAGFGTFALVVGTIVKAIKLWAAAQVALNIVMDANPIGLVIAGVAALAAGIYILYKKSETFRNIVTGAFKAIKTVVGVVGPHIKTILLMTLLGPIGLIIAKWGTLKHVASVAFNAIGDAIHAAWSGIKSAATTIGHGIVHVFTTLPVWLYNAGKNLILGLIHGVGSMAGELWKTVKHLAQGVIHKVTHPWEIFSPSRVFFRIGRNVGQGLVNGIKSMAASVQDAAYAGMVYPIEGAIAALQAQSDRLQALWARMDKAAERRALVAAIRAARAKKSSGGGSGSGGSGGSGGSVSPAHFSGLPVIAGGHFAQSLGLQVGESKYFGGVTTNRHAHYLNDHYSGNSIDINAAGGGRGELSKLTRALALIRAKFRSSVQMAMIEDVGTANQHLHVTFTAKAIAAAAKAHAAKGTADRLQSKVDELEREKRNLPSKGSTGTRKALSDRIANLRVEIRDAKKTAKQGSDVRDAIKALRDFDKEAERARKLAAIDLKVKGLEQLKAFKAAVAAIKSSLHDMASEAAAAFRAMREKQIDDAHAAALVVIGNSADARELEALQAVDVAEQTAATVAQLDKDLADATAAGDEAAIKTAQDAITTYKRSKREEELTANLAAATQAADDAQTAAQGGLDKEEADYEASLEHRLNALTANLGKSKDSYAQFVKDVQSILAPLGLTFPTSADAEATANAGPTFHAPALYTSKPGKDSHGHKGTWHVYPDGHKVFVAGGKAAGGYMMPGRVYRVGELGPEDVQLSGTGARVTQASQSRSGGGDVHMYGPVTIGSRRAAEALANRLAFRSRFG